MFRPRWRGTLGFWAAVAIAVLLAGYLALLELSRPHVSGDELRLDTLTTLANERKLKNAEILDYDSYVVGEYEAGDGSVRRYNAPYLKNQDARGRLAELLIENRVPTTVNQQFAKSLVFPATILLPALILVVIMIYLILSYRRGTGLFGIRSGARRVGAEEADVSFAEVAGQDAAVAELRELSHFLSDPERFRAVGARVPKGVLLYGPPGCGKTLLAKALAGEAGAAFYSISGADFVEMYVGVGASRVRDLFREARENAPAIVFIDELDAVGRRRLSGGAVATGSGDEQSQALNQILAEMDGFSAAQGVIVVGATNRPDVLDPALLRPGRFDRAIGLERPDEQGRLAILSVHARGKPLAADVDLAAVAREAVGMTGADLASVVNEAGLLAARADRTTISREEVEEALRRVQEAPERQRRLAMRDRSLGRQALSTEQVTFADVAGAEEAVQELAEVRDYLTNPERFTAMGARIPRGYLLMGPPGSGKTLLARAVAGESHAAFISVAATEFVEVFAGEGAARVRDLFAEARAAAPAIVFIDEIDAIGARRGAAAGDNRERDQTLNQILVELDGFSPRSAVVVMGATNRPDILDPALVRPGRFDRRVAVELPDRRARRAILELHARGKPLARDVDLDALAGLTRGLSGADLANVLNEAALLAARRGRPEISTAIVDEALDRAAHGISRSHVLSDEERRMVAYHEAGHGLVARALPGGRLLHRLTIVPRGQTLGAAWLPEDGDDRLAYSRSMLVDRMAMLLAGRAAEELALGEVGDGAGADLAQVGRIARRMVVELGMSEAVVALPSVADGADDGLPAYSEDTARLVDAEVRRLVEEADALARSVLSASRDALDRVAQALIERETLTLEDVDEIAGPPPRRMAPATSRPASRAARPAGRWPGRA